MANEIVEDDLIAVTAGTILYMQLTGDTVLGAALLRISDAMKGIEGGDVRVVKSHGLIDPNVKSRMRMAEALISEQEGK